MPTLQEIHDAVGGELRGNDSLEIAAVNSLADAGPNEIAPLENKDYVKAAQASGAGALIVTPKLVDGLDGNLLIHDFPLAAMNTVIPTSTTGRRPTRSDSGP